MKPTPSQWRKWSLICLGLLLPRLVTICRRDKEAVCVQSAQYACDLRTANPSDPYQAFSMNVSFGFRELKWPGSKESCEASTYEVKAERVTAVNCGGTARRADAPKIASTGALSSTDVVAEVVNCAAVDKTEESELRFQLDLTSGTATVEGHLANGSSVSIADVGCLLMSHGDYQDENAPVKVKFAR